jgi:hypothetical protein
MIHIMRSYGMALAPVAAGQQLLGGASVRSAHGSGRFFDVWQQVSCNFSIGHGSTAKHAQLPPVSALLLDVHTLLHAADSAQCQKQSRETARHRGHADPALY